MKTEDIIKIITDKEVLNCSKHKTLIKHLHEKIGTGVFWKGQTRNMMWINIIANPDYDVTVIMSRIIGNGWYPAEIRITKRR